MNELKKPEGIRYLKERDFINIGKFEYLFEIFKTFVKNQSGEVFNSFANTYLESQESYKQTLRIDALEKLDIGTWEESNIGSGKILRNTIQAIELKDNNLTSWHPRYGSGSEDHFKLVDSQSDKSKTHLIENLLFKHFNSRISDEISFQEMIDFFGKKYSIIAYLFYLKDDRKYLPISTTNFDKAFKMLGSDYKTQKKASWQNYCGYLSLISQAKDLIEDKLENQIHFIDAHSFLWILATKEVFGIELSKDISNLKVNKFRVNYVHPVNKVKRETNLIKKQNFEEQNPDFEKQNRSKRINGRRAEELVLEYEKSSLIDAGRTDLAEKVEDYSKRLGIGFDILSFDSSENKKHIEVKYTKGNSFVITRNELNVSLLDPNYLIYLVIVDETNKNHTIKVLTRPDLQNETKFRLEPKEYYVSFDEVK